MAKDKIILALDVDSETKAVGLVRSLKDEVGAFKVGLELFNSTGPDIFGRLRQAGAERVFYDCKFHDIPNTVAGASRAAARMGIWMFNVHTSGGSDMMKAAAEAARQTATQLGVRPPLVIGVTVLTSIDETILREELVVCSDVRSQVAHLALLAKNSSLDGVVASPHEIGAIRDACGSGFLIVTPGVRPAGAAIGDQKRVMTPGEAIRHGADYIVVGRAITASDDPVAAARAIGEEIETVSGEQ
ncbi:MAG: orotidine-5'-phosphate decarboxylase [Armatimonadota bacterium]|nr:orotidine-5'-phosphate decarboxylase [Armatimonadota bacterium]